MNYIKFIKLDISSEIELIADYTFAKVLVSVLSQVLEVLAQSHFGMKYVSVSDWRVSGTEEDSPTTVSVYIQNMRTQLLVRYENFVTSWQNCVYCLTAHQHNLGY